MSSSRHEAKAPGANLITPFGQYGYHCWLMRGRGGVALIVVLAGCELVGGISERSAGDSDASIGSGGSAGNFDGGSDIASGGAAGSTGGSDDAGSEPSECSAGESRCSNDEREMCSGGVWTPAPCQLPSPVCHEGACVGVARLTLGHDYSCALMSDGRVRCWGRNEQGQLGRDPASVAISPKPLVVPGLSGVTAIAAGLAHTCALLPSQEVYCWGKNELGQLGRGTQTLYEHTPQPVKGLSGVVSLGRAKNQHHCAIAAGGKVYCWGNNDSGEVGTGAVTIAETEARLVSGLTANEVVAACNHTCARSGGSVACWGANDAAQLGNGSVGGKFLTPQSMQTAVAAQELATACKTTCLLGNDQLHCCGLNEYGWLAVGSSALHVTAPQPVVSSTGASHAAGGGWASCAIISKQARCWGRTLHGAVGNGTTSDGSATSPSLVQGINGDITQLESSWNHSCALRADGTLFCWGKGQYGEIGDGFAVDRPLAAPVKW